MKQKNYPNVRYTLTVRNWRGDRIAEIGPIEQKIVHRNRTNLWRGFEAVRDQSAEEYNRPGFKVSLSAMELLDDRGEWVDATPVLM